MSKSVIQGTIAASANAKGNRVLFLVHRRELCDQNRQTFTACGINDLTDICMVQTASRHISEIPKPDIIITDEAHHSTAKTYRKIYDAFPDALFLGFTATPIRLNRGGLGEVYTDLITSVSTRWLIDNHYLAPYKYYSVELADTSGLHVRGGEYQQNEVAALMQNREIYGNTVKQWERLAKNRKIIVYTASVEAAKNTARDIPPPLWTEQRTRSRGRRQSRRSGRERSPYYVTASYSARASMCRTANVRCCYVQRCRSRCIYNSLCDRCGINLINGHWIIKK